MEGEAARGRAMAVLMRANDDPVIDIPLWKMPYLVILLAVPVAVSWRFKLGLLSPLIWASARCLVQLAFLGGVLKLIFSSGALQWVVAYTVFMMLVASAEAISRPSFSYKGMHVDVSACLVAPAFGGMVFMLAAMVDPSPWYEPQYVIPLIGMMLGNGLNGVTVGVKSMLEVLSSERQSIEWALAMGATRWEAVMPMYKRVLYTAMTPTINMLCVAGLVSIPGMMTGQILAGGDAAVAAKYQVMILFGVGAVSTISCTAATALVILRLTDSCHRLRSNVGAALGKVWSFFMLRRGGERDNNEIGGYRRLGPSETASSRV